jgi:23S rRNA (cytosine1962-C5)-methyltransferase
MPSPPALAPLRPGPARVQGPAAIVTRRAADRLRAGSVWVYRSEMEQLQRSADGSEVEPGSLVAVLDSRGIPLGTAIFSSASQITLRLVSSVPDLTRAQYVRQITERVAAALSRRDQLVPASEDNNACRLIFSEADQLPGIIADRYHDLVILQLLTQGTAQDDVRHAVTAAIRNHLAPATIVERPDPRIRIVEELPLASAEPLYADREEPKLATTFTINGLNFAYDATAGQKTGAFLDQRLNYAAAARYASGNALDVCTYQGGFALHLAQVCERVTGVDASRAALEVADKNLPLNPRLRAQTDWIEADAFELLREFDSTGRRFETIVLDPPAFAKSKRAAEGAARGYKELNLRALKMLAPGGTLVTCSCSHHVSLADFTEIVTAASADSHRRVQVLESRGAAPDHPAILTLPETTYLKCLICRVD